MIAKHLVVVDGGRVPLCRDRDAVPTVVVNLVVFDAGASRARDRDAVVLIGGNFGRCDDRRCIAHQHDSVPLALLDDGILKSESGRAGAIDAILASTMHIGISDEQMGLSRHRDAIAGLGTDITIVEPNTARIDVDAIETVLFAALSECHIADSSRRSRDNQGTPIAGLDNHITDALNDERLVHHKMLVVAAGLNDDPIECSSTFDGLFDRAESSLIATSIHNESVASHQQGGTRQSNSPLVGLLCSIGIHVPCPLGGVDFDHMLFVDFVDLFVWPETTDLMACNIDIAFRFGIVPILVIVENRASQDTEPSAPGLDSAATLGEPPVLFRGRHAGHHFRGRDLASVLDEHQPPIDFWLCVGIHVVGSRRSDDLHRKGFLCLVIGSCHIAAFQIDKSEWFSILSVAHVEEC